MESKINIAPAVRIGWLMAKPLFKVLGGLEWTSLDTTIAVMSKAGWRRRPSSCPSTLRTIRPMLALSDVQPYLGLAAMWRAKISSAAGKPLMQGRQKSN